MKNVQYTENTALCRKIQQKKKPKKQVKNVSSSPKNTNEATNETEIASDEHSIASEGSLHERGPQSVDELQGAVEFVSNATRQISWQ